MRWIGQITYDEVAYFREDVIIEAGNKLGIGTTSPGANLEVVSARGAEGIHLNDGSFPLVGKVMLDVDANGDGEITLINSNSQLTSVISGGENSYLMGGNVGIGTSSPSEKLDVVGNIKTTGIAKFYNSTSHYGSINADSEGLTLDTVANRHMRFKKAGVEVMRINTSGNVGIGTTSPTYKLHVDNRVASTTGTAKPQAFFSGGSVFGADYRDGQIEFGNSSGLSGALGWDNSTAGVYLDNTWNNDIGFIAFRTHASATPEEVMRITGPGNVGIGTTSPASKLHVAGTVQVGVDDTGHDVIFYGATSGRSMLWDESYDGLILSDNTKLQLGSSTGYGDLQLLHDGTNSYVKNHFGDLYIMNNADDKDIIFQSDNGSGGVTAYLTLDGSTTHSYFSAGNVGIGASSPTQKLHVDGNTLISAEKYYYVAGTGGGFGSDSSGNFKIKQNGSDLIFGSGDNVGIGTSSPASLLHVAGTVQVGVDDTGHDVKFFGATSGKYLLWDESADALQIPDSTYLYFGTGIDLAVYHNGTNSYLQNATGNLEIIQNTDDGDIIFSSDDGSGGVTAYLTLDGGAGNVLFSVDTMLNGGGNYIQVDVSDDSLKFADNAKAKFGTNNDLSIYHNGTNSYIKGAVQANDLIIQNEHIAIKSHSNENMIHCDSDGPVQLYYNGNSKLATVTGGVNITGELEADSLDIDGVAQIDGTLTVGVDDTGHDVKFFGATSGRYLLWDESSDALTFRDTTMATFGAGGDFYISHNGSYTSLMENTSDLYISNAADDKDIIFRCDDGSGGLAAYLTLDGSTTHSYFSAGNVGIGTTGPAGKLDIYDSSSGSLYVRTGGAGANWLTSTTSSQIGTYTDHPFYLKTNDSTAVTILGSGNVGIGITAPTQALHLPDSKVLALGTSADLQIYHDTNHSIIKANGTGNLIIRQDTDDADIVFKSDDNSGGSAEYFKLQGSSATNIFSKDVLLTDDISLKMGNASDMKLYHDGSNSYINQQGTGDLYLRQNTDDGDIIFQSDDGSGGLATYLTLDGGEGRLVHSVWSRYIDGARILIGTGGDLALYHSGSDSYITSATGNLYIDSGANDADIIFKGTDGGADITALTLDMSDGGTAIFNHDIKIADDGIVKIGDSTDLYLSHDGTNSHIASATGDLKITQNANDKDIIFNCDDGSGGNTAYLTLDGGLGYTTAQKAIRFDDSVKAAFGSGLDLQLYHNGSHSYIENNVGNIAITNNTDDGDIIFSSDDGSGGTTAYLTLDGSSTVTRVHKNMRFDDSAYVQMGASSDLSFVHNGSNSFISNTTGNLTIQQTADNADIIFQSDDGSGGVMTYLYLDGSATGYVRIPDNGVLAIGTSADLLTYHDGSHSYISNQTGDLYIRNNSTDKDIILMSDDGSGGETAYLTLDGSAGTVEIAKEMNLAVPLATDQQKHLAYFEFKGYGTSDGTNYEMSEVMTDQNAPLEHDTSTGSDGLTAQTIQTIMRSGGTVMPRAGVLKKFIGWVTSAGSGSVDVGLFKVTPTDDTAGNLTPILLVNEQTTASGNAIPNSFSEDSSFDAGFSAGDIIYSAVKGGTDAKAWYFSSTLEVEWT